MRDVVRLTEVTERNTGMSDLERLTRRLRGVLSPVVSLLSTSGRIADKMSVRVKPGATAAARIP